MKKRILSSLLTAIFTLSLFVALPVSASTIDISSIATDYVAGEVTGNLITAESLSANYNGVSSIGTANAGTEDEAWTIGTSNQVADDAWGVGGAIISKSGYDNAILAAGKSVVISAKVRNNTGTPIIKTSAYQYSKSPVLPIEYPTNTSGKEITNTEWENFGTTIKFSETEFMGANNTNLLIGLAHTGTTETTRTFEILKGSMYIGEEYAYDMEITADSTLLTVNDKVNVSGRVLNQGGTTGYLSQSISWYALNEARTAFVSGITITETSENSAIVSVDGAPEGVYYIVAVADADAKIVKSVRVEIKALADYIPGDIEGNVLTNPVEISKNYNHNAKLSGESGKIYDVEVGTTTFSSDIKLKAMRYIDDPHIVYADDDGDGIYSWNGSTMNYSWALSGGIVSNDFGDDASKKANVVFSFDLKNSGSTDSVTVNFGRTNNAYLSTMESKAEYPTEYSTKDSGIAVTSRTSWTTFEGMFKNTGGNTVQNYSYVIGLAQGNAKNAAVTVSADAYMGVEYAHNINVTADNTVWIHGITDNITLDVDILNQIGKTGGLSQKVSWYAMNNNRTQSISGFNFKQKDDGNTVLTVSDTVPAGSYDLVAVSDENNEIIKGITITVEGRNKADQYLWLDFEENSDLSSAILTETAQVSLTKDSVSGTNAMQVMCATASDSVSFPLRTVEGNTYKISLWLKTNSIPESQNVYFDIVNSANDSGADVKNTISATKSKSLEAGEWVYVTAEYTANGSVFPDGEISLRIGDGLSGAYIIDDFFVVPYVDNKVDDKELIEVGTFDSLSEFADWNVFIEEKILSSDKLSDYFIEDGYEGGAIKITTVKQNDGFSTKYPLDIELCKKYEFSFYAKAMNNDDTVGKSIWFFLSFGGEDYTGEIGKYVHITNSSNPTLTTDWQKFTFEIDLDYITADIPEIWLGFRVGDNAELRGGLRPIYTVDNISLKQTGDTNFSVNSTLYGAVNDNAVLQFNNLDSTKGEFIYRIVKETQSGDFVVQSGITENSMVEFEPVDDLADSKLRLDLIGLDGYGNYSQVHTNYINTENLELSDTVTLRPNNYLWNDDIDTLSASLKYKSETELKNLNVYGALYDANGKMVSIQSAPLSVNKNEENTATASLSLKDEKGQQIAASKATFFAWFEDSQMPATATNQLEKTNGEFIYVDVNSTESIEDGTYDAPYKTLEAAQTAWRNAVANCDESEIYVVLKSGEYFIDETLALTTQDCADGKTLTFTTLSGEKASLTGGKHIAGFTEYKNGIYRAKVPSGTNSRQLYINGIKATRARSIEDVKGFTNLDSGATKDNFANNGLICTDASYVDYKYPNELELAFIENWRHHYITADTITKTDDGALFGFTESGNMEAWKKIVTLQTPATVPVYLENALELLDEPGEWYLDTHENYLYYMPRAFEDINTADVIIPVTQELVTVTGTVDEPVKNINFKNIDFCYSAWNYPTINRNYLNSQGAFYGTQTTAPADTGSQLPDGAVELDNAHFITIDNCDFAHLGSMALRMTGAIQNCNIIGNEFYEISGAAMALGENEGKNVRNPQESKYYITDNLIVNNYIHKVADDYYSAAAISVGFPKNTTIRNNELVDGAYSGFHIGWGWTDTTPAATENFVIESNYIHNFMNWRLFDGASIYSVGKTGGTKENPNIIRKNYIQDILKSPAGIYPDQGSTFWKISENVIDTHRYASVYYDKESIASSPSWLNIWEYRISDIYVENNYSTTANYRNEGTRIEFEQAEIYPDANWPEAAQKIINDAGIESEYRDRFDFDIQILTLPTRLDVPKNTTVPFAYNALSAKNKLCDLSDYEITVKSSDESVATATADSITGVSAGKAWITYMLCKKNAEGEVVYYDEHTFCVVVK